MKIEKISTINFAFYIGFLYENLDFIWLFVLYIESLLYRFSYEWMENH